MRIRTILLASTLAAGAVVAATGQPAAASVCRASYTDPYLYSGTFVEANGELFCTNPLDPRDGTPLRVTIQRSNNGSTGWSSVAQGIGLVDYLCTGVTPHYFRLAEKPSVVVNLACT